MTRLDRPSWSSGAAAADVRAVLSSYVSRVTVEGMMRAAADRAGVAALEVDRHGVDPRMLEELRRGVAVFVPEARRAECLTRLSAMARAPAARPSKPDEVEVVVADENGIVDARTRARACAAEIGFDAITQHKIATAVSELARNMFRYAGGGIVRFGEVSGVRRGLFVTARDEGPGIAHLSEVLGGSYRSRTGLGKGLLGCKRMMDDFDVDTGPARGTTVTLRKFL